MVFMYLQTFTKLAADNFTKEIISILLLNIDIFGNLICFGQKRERMETVVENSIQSLQIALIKRKGKSN